MPVIGRSSGASFDQVLQVPMDRANGHCALSGGAGHTLDRAVAHVARGEYARQAGLERQRRTLQWPRRPVKVAAGTRTDRPPRFRTHSTRKEPEIIRPSAQQAQLEKDAVPHASNQLSTAPPPALGNPTGADFGWILGQFATLGRTDLVRAMLDSGLAVDTGVWSNFTPLDQAAMHGRTNTVRLLLQRRRCA
jgi:hypothetical protein